MSEPDTPEFDESVEDSGPLTLPLDAWHRARGARMVPFAGYWMPVQYEGIIAEHTWTRGHAGLFDVSHMGQLYLSGEGLDAAVEAVLSIDLATLKPGSVRYSLLLNADGGILDDLMVTRWESGLYMVVNGATKWDDIGHLREFLPDEIALNHMEEPALLALQGPEAAAALARVTDGDVAGLKFMKSGAFRIAGVDAWISRSGYTGEDGFEISLPGESAAAIADLLCSQPEVKPIGLGARDSLRLEAGLPLYGHDLNEDTDPVSADLAFGINKRRKAGGGFPGAARILPLLAGGAPRKRVGLALDGRQAAREGAGVFAGDREVGVLTSGGFSPTLGRPIAMAYVDAASAADGTGLTIDVRGKRLPAKVVPMPFVPHKYHR
ncbi:MAG: glycine cleavage system aminomethyltransferase GcvT [Sphingomonadales bacterium]|nr:glycine cleavage system aminomethyltransferase GcvT [Sphingomonadales bacterium]